MDNRILGAGAVLGVLLLGGIGAFVITGGDGEGPKVEKAEKVGKKGKKAAPLADADGADERDGPMRPSKAEPDRGPEYQARVEEYKEIRATQAKEWREETTALAQEWVVQAGLDEATSVQVMTLFSKAHDTIAQTRADIEDGVIHPREGRDEMKWAKEEFRTELNNLLGEEKSAAFLEYIAKAKRGGI